MANGMKMTTSRARKATTNGIARSQRYSILIRGDDISKNDDDNSKKMSRQDDNSNKNRL
jgi:hypothetical protein